MTCIGDLPRVQTLITCLTQTIYEHKEGKEGCVTSADCHPLGLITSFNPPILRVGQDIGGSRFNHWGMRSHNLGFPDSEEHLILHENG